MRHEVNIDTLAGPTHHYGGLSFGNVASQQHEHQISHPKEAALQGLEKMKCLHDLGIPQIVLAPHIRPHVRTLRELGFTGSDSEVIERAALHAPRLLSQCSSASAMWTANAAHITASADTRDGRVRITCANLVTHLHRHLEAAFTERQLRHIFADPRFFVHHGSLPSVAQFADEGAANDTRFCDKASEGLYLFVWGRSEGVRTVVPHTFPARQTREAYEVLLRQHGIREAQCVLAQQNPACIDQGVFHNDVIATGHECFFLVHEDAYTDTPRVIHELQEKASSLFGEPLSIWTISKEQLSVSEAVRSYLFNAQIVTVSGRMVLIAPSECQKEGAAKRCLDELLHDARSPISEIRYLNLNQSMHNGGGPACLRLRVVLTDEELRSVHRGSLFSDTLYRKLKAIIEQYFPDQFSEESLRDPTFLQQAYTAYEEIAEQLKLPGIYDGEW